MVMSYYWYMPNLPMVDWKLMILFFNPQEQRIKHPKTTSDERVQQRISG